jgi:hypothetical protein
VFSTESFNKLDVFRLSTGFAKNSQVSLTSRTYVG